MNNCFIHTLMKISLYTELLAIQHTVLIKIYTEVAPHIKVTVAPLGFIACQCRNRKVACVFNENVSVIEVSACFIHTVFPITVYDLVFVRIIKILKIILK